MLLHTTAAGRGAALQNDTAVLVQPAGGYLGMQIVLFSVLHSVIYHIHYTLLRSNNSSET
jgi:hypothetical protein